MKAILFDCDGTIADSCAMICEIMRMVFTKHDQPVPSDAATRAIIGLSLDTAIGQLKPDASIGDVAKLAESYRTIFRASRSEPRFREALFPGMRDLIDRLAARSDVRLGMVTGKSRRGVDSICQTHGMTGCFSVVRTADDCPSKPDPAMVLESCAALDLKPSDALVVGDSIYDMQMARNAGAAGMGVAWGTFAPASLVSAGAFAVAETVDDLGARIDRWLAEEPAEMVSGLALSGSSTAPEAAPRAG